MRRSVPQPAIMKTPTGGTARLLANPALCRVRGDVCMFFVVRFRAGMKAGMDRGPGDDEAARCAGSSSDINLRRMVMMTRSTPETAPDDILLVFHYFVCRMC